MFPSLIVFHSVALSAFLELYPEHLVIVSYCHVIIFFFPSVYINSLLTFLGKLYLSIYLFISYTVLSNTKLCFSLWHF